MTAISASARFGRDPPNQPSRASPADTSSDSSAKRDSFATPTSLSRRASLDSASRRASSPPASIVSLTNATPAGSVDGAASAATCAARHRCASARARRSVSEVCPTSDTRANAEFRELAAANISSSVPVTHPEASAPPQRIAQVAAVLPTVSTNHAGVDPSSSKMRVSHAVPASARHRTSAEACGSRCPTEASPSSLGSPREPREPRTAR